MRHLRHELRRCALFAGVKDVELALLLRSSRHRVSQFSRGQVIAVEGAVCSHLVLVLDGEVSVQKMSPSGDSLVIARMGQGSALAEAVVFLPDPRYPATLVAAGDQTRLLFVPRDEVAAWCRRSQGFLSGFLRLLSERVIMLNRKVELLSYRSIRQKVCRFMLDESRKRGKSAFTLELSRQEMADYLGIPRPSLSREMAVLRDRGWILFDRNQAELLDRGALERCLID